MSNVYHGLEVIGVSKNFAKLIGVNSILLTSPERTSWVTLAVKAKKPFPKCQTFPNMSNSKHQKPKIQTTGRENKKPTQHIRKKRGKIECTHSSDVVFLPTKGPNQNQRR
jgi:hypothetical protein